MTASATPPQKAKARLWSAAQDLSLQAGRPWTVRPWRGVLLPYATSLPRAAMLLKADVRLRFGSVTPVITSANRLTGSLRST